MFVVFVFRIYALRGAIMYSRMLLCLSGAQALYALLYNANNVNYLWYGIIVLTVFYSLCLLCLLPTPQEEELIDQMTQTVLETAADIQVNPTLG